MNAAVEDVPYGGLRYERWRVISFENIKGDGIDVDRKPHIDVSTSVFACLLDTDGNGADAGEEVNRPQWWLQAGTWSLTPIGGKPAAPAII